MDSEGIETIAAQATPPGQGGVGIIRVSGPLSTDIAKQLLGRCPEVRKAEYLPFLDASGQLIDMGIALFFQGPHSFTGEDVLELQGHGGPMVMDCLLKAVLACGVRVANPGEFSQRAFLNGKMDLAQAEAVADLIAASSEQAVRSAVSSVQGKFSEKVQTLLQGLTRLRCYIEGALDFPEEEIDFLDNATLTSDLNGLQQQLEQLFQQTQQGAVLQEGLTVVIAGKPNAGKSSLLNALSGRDAAIVTDIPGTTRDVLREQIHLDGVPLHVVDTAGLRQSGDAIEQEGIRRAKQELIKADRVLLVVDGSEKPPASRGELLAGLGLDSELLAAIPVTVVINKIDLKSAAFQLDFMDGVSCLKISAKTGEGLAELQQHLLAAIGWQGTTEGIFTARRRHLEAMHEVKQHFSIALAHLQRKDGELAAEELRLSQQALAVITGEFSADDLLGEIFSTFCIGK